MEFAALATQEPMVSTSSPLDAKEQIRQAVDIVDLVGSHVPLRRQGRNYVGLCPWHDDTRPSMQVNPERQSFKCWVCDIGGDIFSFVMQIEGVEFREALQMLAERAGITLQPYRSSHGGPVSSISQPGVPEPGDPSAAPFSGEGKRTLFKAMAWAEGRYHDCLLDEPEGEPARKYLQERGITPESIEQFHLGFAPNQRDWILRQLKGNTQREKIIEAVGLVARPAEGGAPYDRFRGRVLFSIRDAQGRPVGVGGRVLPESGSTSPAKYINSPETPLFSKSNLLYGLDVAREAMRKTGQALVMEGYTDVIVAHQYGFTNAVAVLGTALGEGHIRILKRFTDQIVLVLDGDEAGQRRANEVLELFVAQQADLRILTLPEGSDPCDFLQTHGAEAFEKLLAEQAVDALEHAVKSATKGLDIQNDVHGATKALERLVAIVARAPRLRQDTTGEDRFREQKILQRLAAWFRIDEQEIRQRLTAVRRRLRSRAPAREAVMPEVDESMDELPAAIDPAWCELLELIVLHPECFPTVRRDIRPEQMPPGPLRAIYETCCRLAESGVVPDFDRLMLEFEQPAIKNLLVDLDEQGRAKGDRQEDLAALVETLVKSFQHKEAQRQRPTQITALREGRLDDSQEAALLENIVRQERNRQGISEPTDG